MNSTGENGTEKSHTNFFIQIESTFQSRPAGLVAQMTLAEL